MTIRNVLDGAELDTCICTKKNRKNRDVIREFRKQLDFFFKKIIFQKKGYGKFETKY